MAAEKRITRFSDFFNLGMSQAQLDFVDIPMETDIPLFVDPYALHVSSEDWLRECGNYVVGYFETLVELIRNQDDRAVLQLLDNFHEPNQTHLGLSSGRPSGRGWGVAQAKQLQKVLKSSAAVTTGRLTDLGDYEMFIPGIGPDKISDLATNIIKGELITYTQEQCGLLGIKTERVNAGKCWEPVKNTFVSRYEQLPLCPSGPLILVPKTAVRTRLVPSRDTFYSRFILDYLEAEHISANDSLVTVLKGGHRKVFRKDLREKHPMTSEQIFDFGRKHPDILKKYKDSLPTEAKPITNEDIEWRQQERREVRDAGLADQLSHIQPGRAHAAEFHTCIVGLLQAIFYPMLTRPKKEQEINEGRKRIDISFTNASDLGFFSHLVNRHHVHAPYIAVECKNYNQDPENPEFDQLLGRLSRTRGNCGLLVCRQIDNAPLLLKRCKDVLNSRAEISVIIVLDDDDLKALLVQRNSIGDQGVSDYMQTKLDQLMS